MEVGKRWRRRKGKPLRSWGCTCLQQFILTAMNGSRVLTNLATSKSFFNNLSGIRNENNAQVERKQPTFADIFFEKGM
uniref:Uncharacterized protein n=1 Tax=Romanomermis culicivorax TaxID=13658 RepID=A0A915KC81_ROMCU